MSTKNFTQGMSNKDASKHNLGTAGLTDKDATERYQTSFDGLKDRPDYDGVVTISEAEDWYNNGNGQPLYVDASKINLNGAFTGLFNIGEEKGYNFFLDKNADPTTARVYGTLAITLKDKDGTVSLVPSKYANSGKIDDYNFDQHPGQPVRNFVTRRAESYLGKGNGYDIYGYGTGKINTTSKHYIINYIFK